MSMLRSGSVRQVRRRLAWCSRQPAQSIIRANDNVGACLAVGWQQSQQHRSFVDSRKGDNLFSKDVPIPEPAVLEDLDFYDEFDDSDDEEEVAANTKEEAAAEAERQKVRNELDSRTGRLWTDPWEITNEDWGKMRTTEDMPDWSPELCSRVSLERVQIYEDGIPTLSALANMALPPSAPPHPGHGKTKIYAKMRKQQQYEYIKTVVVKKAEPQIAAILKLSTWQEKQDAVDELFENVEFALKEDEKVLAQHPNFGAWVERALEEYLRAVGEEKQEADDGKNDETGEPQKVHTGTPPTAEEDAKAVPVFADLFEKGNEDVVPKLLHPLKPHAQDGPGRMVEEWELAANKNTKRIMLRQSTRQLAQLLEDTSKPVRVYVSGHRGVGKTTVLATIVASARRSGCIVLYMPDGDRLRKNGYYVEPSSRRDGMFDLPILSQEVCTELLTSHETDMEGLTVDATVMESFFAEKEMKKLPVESKDNVSLVELLETGRDHPELAPMCYSAVVHTLMNQTEKDFVVVSDEFNCFYDHGHYFHMEYDEQVHKAIPCDKINLFEPIMNAMGISTADKDAEALSPPVVMKRGGIVVGVTESHAVARKFTDALTASAKREAAVDTADAPLHVVEVPRFSSLEVEHIVANFEAIGMGRLRFDRGETVMNPQEVAYINMVSGGVGQNLVDECVM